MHFITEPNKLATATKPTFMILSKDPSLLRLQAGR